MGMGYGGTRKLALSTLRFEAFPITTTPHLKVAEGCDLMAHRGEAT